jgi:SAM-dependent methyltransferase
MDVLREWKRVLKPGGKLIIETPDFIGSCREVATSNDEEWIKQLCSHFLAWPWLPGQTHYFLYSEAQLRLVLIQCGFVNVRRVVPDSLYARCNPTKHHIYLKMECEKPK